ncbi:hypothetical protein Ciccas_011122 [Cichlidogyrus casuarinus]|uniref:Uncharacterized protein n=1 Tax=Cichlidogyrus casuarinus TaxID=1844966 RepID=A0ABD2PSZ4_9PLAT
MSQWRSKLKSRGGQKNHIEQVMTEELSFSLSCTLFVVDKPEQEIRARMLKKSYATLKREVEKYINEMEEPEAKFDFEDFELIEESYRNQKPYDAYNYFLCYSSACHQDWFKDEKEDETSAYRQVLLAWTVVRMVELSTINDTIQCNVPLPENHIFSYFSLMGIFAYENNWKDKAACVTLNDPNISTKIDSYRNDFAKRYLDTTAGSEGKIKEIGTDEKEKAEITSDGQLAKLNEYLKALLAMLLCTSMSQEERLDILTENVGLLAGVRAYYEERFPEEYNEAFEKCLAISDEMDVAYSEGSVWKGGEIMEQVCLDRYRAWKIRATEMDAQIGAIWQMLLLVLLLGLLAELAKHYRAWVQYKRIFSQTQLQAKGAQTNLSPGPDS